MSMNTLRSSILYLVLYLLCVSLTLCFLGGCESDIQGKSCSQDSECLRGSICQDDVCTTQACDTIEDCTGSGRTCLVDLNQCSPKECGDLNAEGNILSCEEAQYCLTQGPYQFSCSTIGENDSCTADQECNGHPNGSVCCNNTCSMTCNSSGGITAGTTAGETTWEMSGEMSGEMAGEMAGIIGGTNAGTMSTTPASLCSTCIIDSDCSELSPNAQCELLPNGESYCTRPCDEANSCPGEYICLTMTNLCVPRTYECVDCLKTPCTSGTFCDLDSGTCISPQPLCSSCSEDAACIGDLVCAPIGSRKTCLNPCNDGMCTAGSSCVDNACIPDNQVCDACNGSCSDETPYCLNEEARCVACTATNPCINGLNCDLSTNTCVEQTNPGSCLSDIDCEEGLLCFNGGCVQCFQDTDCAPRNICNLDSFSCEYSACAGVECHRGSSCNAQDGLCAPGCSTADDCAVPEAMGCNTSTQQCYFLDGRCEFGGDGVCPPGSQCVINPLTMMATCSCKPGVIECHPDLVCNDLQAILDLLMLDIDLSELGIEASCGNEGF
jgi:hypothetical protein